ncbi:receptor-type tyrosine-protein phosphatase S-like [Sycon ciliatum]|uniref:receptor-type tyrosine-protein phosphatase S-like n=1 Tax=Sycon ciliatum TaxID=27933 RepID=UPI0031F61444
MAASNGGALAGQLIAVGLLLVLSTVHAQSNSSAFLNTLPIEIVQVDGGPVVLTISATQAAVRGILNWRYAPDSSTNPTSIARHSDAADISVVRNGLVMQVNLSFPMTAAREGLYSIAILGDFDDLVEETNFTSVRIAVEPEITTTDDIVVNEGSDAVMRCNSTGFPVPLMQWWDGEGQLLVERYTTSLEYALPNVQRGSAEDYVCNATNMAGDVNITRKLIVQYKPEITGISQSQLLPVEGPLLLTCSAIGVPAPHVFWTHHRHNLTLVNHLVLTRARDEHHGGLRGHSNVSSAQTMTGDEGQYTCHAINAVSSVRSHAHITLQHRPDAPVLKAVDSMQVTTDSVMISWPMPNYHNSTIILYEVEVRLRDNDTWIAVPVASSTVTALDSMITGLTPWSEYHFRVRALNAIGYSDFSNETAAVRTYPLDPVAPEDVEVMLAEATSITLRWQLPDTWTDQRGVLRRVLVSYKRQTSGATGMLLQENVTVGAGETMGDVRVSGLEKGSQYSFKVTFDNGFSMGGSFEVSGNTTITKPGNATSFEASTLSHEKIRVTWSGLDDGGTSLTRLVLQYKETDDENMTWTPVDTATPPPLVTDHSIVLTGFSTQTTYRFRLVVHNSKGKGRPTSVSNDITTPEFQYPPAVVLLAVTPRARSALIVWSLTDENPLVPITHYTILWQTDSMPLVEEANVTATPGLRQYNIEGLKRDASISMRMRANNEYGSARSFTPQVIFKTGRGLPSPLREVLLRENGPDKVKLFWRLDLTVDEYPATELLFSLKHGGQGGADIGDIAINITKNSGEHILRDLKPQTAYIVNVYAVNDFGRSELARERAFRTQAAPPKVSSPTMTITSTVVKSGGSDSNKTTIIAIIAASCFGVLLIMLMIVYLIYVKRRRTKTDGWQVDNSAPAPTRSGSGWYSGSVREKPPITEHTDGSSASLSLQRTASDNSWAKSPIRQPSKASAMVEDEHDEQLGTVQPTTFTSFSLARQPSANQMQTPQQQQRQQSPPPAFGTIPDPPSPPSTPPRTPPLTPFKEMNSPSPPKYQSSPIVSQPTHISDGHDFSEINQTNTFAPLARAQQQHSPSPDTLKQDTIV